MATLTRSPGSPGSGQEMSLIKLVQLCLDPFFEKNPDMNRKICDFHSSSNMARLLMMMAKIG